jgi:DtxR family Mn-dependent transcriptional regulator
MLGNEYVPDDLSLPQQNYIEVIAELIRDAGHARATDVAELLGVSLPSVSEAVKRLAELGLVERKSRFEISLSAGGRRIAQQLQRRHQALKRFMTEVMAMNEEKADQVACRVEHCVDGEFAERLRTLAEFLEREYPWTLKGIADHLRNGRRKEQSERSKGFQI